MANNSSSALVTEGETRLQFVAYITGEMIIATVAASGNGLVIVAIITRPQLQTVTNYFVASLAAADFLVGVFGIPCAVISFVGLYQDYVSCVMVNMIIIILTQISLFGLCAVAIERFIAIKYPYRYAGSCTIRLSVISVAFIWLAGVVFSVTPLEIWDKSSTYDGRCAFTAVIDMRQVVYVHVIVGMFTPLTFMFAVYCYIFHIVRRQVRRIAAVQQMAPATGGAAIRTDAKAAKWFAVVIFFFAVCWLPLHVMNVVTLYGGPTCLPCLLAAIILSHANSAVNPILYAYTNSKFKVAFREILRIKQAENGTVVALEAR